LRKYIYHGPFTCVTLNATETAPLSGEATELEVTLHPGATVELPSDNPYVMTLIELGRLTLAPADPVDDAALPSEPSPKTPAIATPLAPVAQAAPPSPPPTNAVTAPANPGLTAVSAAPIPPPNPAQAADTTPKGGNP
jgi:hypothetical protein